MPSRSASRCSGFIDSAGESGCRRAPEERLVGVDVADPGDPLLVEQEGLERRPAAGGDLAETLGGELVGQRLDAEPRGEVGVELPVPEQQRLAEAPRVGEPELAPVVEDEAGAQVAL